MLAFDWKFTLTDNDLPKVIGTAALAGLGIGFPLLSEDLVEFSLKLPSNWKVRGVDLRWFFKEALRDFLPRPIIEKKKHGFGLPFGIWMLEDEALRSFATEALRSLATRKIVVPSFVDALLDTRLPAYPSYYGEMVWVLMILELWLQEYAPEWRFAA
jgi:asparagine synthase (glutamine-hydrolysing)